MSITAGRLFGSDRKVYGRHITKQQQNAVATGQRSTTRTAAVIQARSSRPGTEKRRRRVLFYRTVIASLECHKGVPRYKRDERNSPLPRAWRLLSSKRGRHGRGKRALRFVGQHERKADKTFCAAKHKSKERCASDLARGTRAGWRKTRLVDPHSRGDLRCELSIRKESERSSQ